MVVDRERLSLSAVVYLLSCILVASVMVGCGRKAELPKKQPRPVAVLELEKTSPAARLRLTGSVESWKEEDIGFEVKGRVQWTIEEGLIVEGRTFDEKGNMITEGTILARLDPTRHELGVSSTEAKLAATRAQAEALQIHIKEVLAEQLKAAKANLDLATVEYKRARDLFKQEVVSEQDVDRTKAAFETASANVDGVNATIAAKKAELKSLEADGLQIEEELKEAKVDLADCTLYSPFNGQVSKLHVIPGAYVEPGRPAVTVVVMDPIKVEVAVSAAVERTLAMGDAVQVYPPGQDEPTLGFVWYKETTADRATRTFKVTMMVRNYLVLVSKPKTEEAAKLPKISKLFTPQLLDMGKPKSPLMIREDALYKDGKGDYVLKVAGLQFDELRSKIDPILTLKRVPVEVGDRRLTILGTFFREVADTGALRMRQDLLAADVEKGVKDGDRVFYTREQWLLRPGDVVSVWLGGESPGEGFYVPMRALIAHGQRKGEVCIVEEGKVRKIPVKIDGTVGDLFRIEAADADGAKLITNGAKVISRDIHFLVNGEAVRVTKREGPAQ